MSLVSINYPAAACLFMLALMAFYHLLRSRKQEFETTVLPSTLSLSSEDAPVSLWTETDLSINCPLSIQKIACRTLFVGPKAILEGGEIHAERIIVDGKLLRIRRITARDEVTVTNELDAYALQVPRLVLKRNATAAVRIVAPETKVIRGHGAQMKGFFSSEEELYRIQGSSAKREVSTPQSSVRVLRRSANSGK